MGRGDVRRAALVLGTTAATLVYAGPAIAGRADAATPAKTVRVPFPRYDGTLTPYTFELGYSLMTLAYDTLLVRDAKGVPKPWLAHTVQRSRDGRRLILRLRDDARWHDGRPLTSADVAFTLRFVVRRFHPRFTPQLENVARVRTPSRRTVVIDLRRPSLGFADQPLADLPILPAHIWRGLPGDQVAPKGPAVGSGPYRLVAQSPRRGYRFVATRSHFGGRPLVARIDVPIIADVQRSYRALRDRDVDMLPATLPAQVARQLGGSFGVDVARGPAYTGTALMLNARRPPFDRPDARRALAAALNLERLTLNVAPAVSADHGYLHPASSWASRTVLHRFDLSAARRAVVELGLPEVPVLAPDNDAVRLEAGRQVVLALRRAGARARLVKRSAAALGQTTGEGGEAPTFTATIVSIPALASYDPDLLGRLFGSRARRARLDVSGYRSAQFDALAGRVATARTQGPRRRAVRAMLERLARDAPAVPLFFSDGAFAYRPTVHNRWSYIKGLGILDKRSFLAGGAPARPSRAGTTAQDSASDGGAVLDVLSIVSLLVLIGAVGVGVAVLARNRRSSQ